VRVTLKQYCFSYALHKFGVLQRSRWHSVAMSQVYKHMSLVSPKVTATTVLRHCVTVSLCHRVTVSLRSLGADV